MQEEKLIITSFRVIGGILLGLGYVALTFNASFFPAGAMGGALIGLFTSLFDQWFFPSWLRRRRFATVLIIRTLSYLFIISLSIGLTVLIWDYLKNGKSIPDARYALEQISSQFSKPFYWEVVLISFLFLFLIQFVALMSRVMGRNVLLNYLLGRYYHPKEEERIFLFMDIKSSTHMAEKLGHFEWHRMLNDFFFDIAEPIKRTRGEIYQYVGDEVVISWPRKLGVKNLNCIQCFFIIEAKIQARRKRYQSRYRGFEPVIKAGYHLGKVVAGEIGDYKRSIVFHGDTINTASRIQAETNRIGRRLLLSGDLLNALDIKGQYQEEFIGKILLRGKEREVTLFSLDQVYTNEQDALNEEKEPSRRPL
ncbi:MAG: adenylate/guanylate cyclase domain-containing protein [Bacteroidota bacterium]